MMSLWDALRMNMMISYQELVRTFLSQAAISSAMTGSSQNGEIRRLVFILASVCEAGVS